ncbi:hypothetical protein BH09MYX1_BH09MYX1_65990 [soil metagenome]
MGVGSEPSSGLASPYQRRLDVDVNPHGTRSCFEAHVALEATEAARGTKTCFAMRQAHDPSTRMQIARQEHVKRRVELARDPSETNEEAGGAEPDWAVQLVTEGALAHGVGFFDAAAYSRGENPEITHGADLDGVR